MKTRSQCLLFTSVLLLSATGMACAQGTAFTYHGRLNDNGIPATGSYDLTFNICTNASGPAQVGATLTNSAVAVNNGLFTVTLDFGTGVFDGRDRWLELGVRTSGGGAFTTLTPRQKLTPTPYAITAETTTQWPAQIPPLAEAVPTSTTAMPQPAPAESKTRSTTLLSEAA